MLVGSGFLAHHAFSFNFLKNRFLRNAQAGRGALPLGFGAGSRFARFSRRALHGRK